ncbi:hypothetical protein [Streptomyces sp. NPDC004286]|uniref:hypothetical protein n=1 Tax=Streptomyces sp. NPDC004286 TaxID=3364696 RepID=UPI00368F4496
MSDGSAESADLVGAGIAPRPRRLLLACVAALLVSGCGAGGQTAGTGDTTMQQAAEQADSMLDDTLGAIEPGVQWTHGATSAGSCDVSRRRVVMTVISPGRVGSLLGLVQRSWETSGYRIKSVNKDEEFPAIYAQSRDGYGIALTVGAERQVFFEATTPCVKQSDVSAPTASPNGPAYKYPVPRPNVHSEFWS